MCLWEFISPFLHFWSSEAHRKYGGMGTILVSKVGQPSMWTLLFSHLSVLLFSLYIIMYFFCFGKLRFQKVYLSGFCRIRQPVWRIGCWSCHQWGFALHWETRNFCMCDVLSLTHILVFNATSCSYTSLISHSLASICLLIWFILVWLYLAG